MYASSADPGTKNAIQIRLARRRAPGIRYGARQSNASAIVGHEPAGEEGTPSLFAERDARTIGLERFVMNVEGKGRT
jgi:hypothetical protein